MKNEKKNKKNIYICNECLNKKKNKKQKMEERKTHMHQLMIKISYYYIRYLQKI